MGVVHLSEPAEPGFRPCPLCLSAAKQYQWELYAEMIEGGLAEAADKVTWIPWPNSGPLVREGNWRGIAGDAPQLGVIDGLCWDHLAGFGRPKQPSQLLEGAPIPPGLLKGKGR